MLAEDKEEKCYPFRIIEGKEEFVIDTLPLVGAIVEERREGRDVVVIATRFHWSLSQIVLRVCQLLRDRWNLNEVALSGGVFQNSLILKQVTYLLNLSGFEVLLHNLLPPNDGGISLGQAVIAYQRVKEKE